MVSFLSKIVIASTLLSLAIKFGGPYLPIPATSLAAGLMIMSVPLAMTAFLSWRWLRREQVP